MVGQENFGYSIFEIGRLESQLCTFKP